MPSLVIRLTIAAFACTIVAGVASAQRTADPCSRKGSATACYVAHQTDYLAIFGLPTAESRRAAGDEVRRAMFFGRSLSPIVAVEFRRAAGQEPTVSIYVPREGDAVALATPAVSAAVPLAEWNRISQRSGFFDREVAPLPSMGEVDGERAIWLCADGGLDIVEVTQPDTDFRRRPVRQRAEDTCDQGLGQDYAVELAETAARLIPACAGLDRQFDLPRSLQGCGMLGGDRMAAGEVYNMLDEFRLGAVERAQAIFASSATLDWMGQQVSEGRSSGELWVARTRGTEPVSFFPRSLVGETADRVVLRAVLERWTDSGTDAPVLWNAPVEMIWVRRLRTFEIQRVVVGEYRQVQARCHPGRLTGAGGC